MNRQVNLHYIREHKGLQIMSLHAYFPQTYVFLKSWAGLKSLPISSIDVSWKELFNGVPHIPEIQKFDEIHQKWQPSNWCQHSHPWHSKRWLMAFMWRTWNLQLYLECWHCCALVEGVVFHFSHWTWSLLVWCCCHHLSQSMRQIIHCE